MNHKILIVLGAVGLLVLGFVSGVLGQRGNEVPSQNPVGATTIYDSANFAGDVYQGLSDVLMMRNGLFVGPLTEVNENITSTTTSNVLTLAESGKTIYLSGGASTTTLPAVSTSAGAIFRFVIAGAITNAGAVISSAEGDNIEGTLLVNGSSIPCVANDVLTFVGTAEDIGDFLEVRSNGTNWFIGSSMASSTGGITCSG